MTDDDREGGPSDEDLSEFKPKSDRPQPVDPANQRPLETGDPQGREKLVEALRQADSSEINLTLVEEVNNRGSYDHYLEFSRPGGDEMIRIATGIDEPKFDVKIAKIDDPYTRDLQERVNAISRDIGTATLQGTDEETLNRWRDQQQSWQAELDASLETSLNLDESSPGGLGASRALAIGANGFMELHNAVEPKVDTLRVAKLRLGNVRVASMGENPRIVRNATQAVQGRIGQLRSSGGTALGGK